MKRFLLLILALSLTGCSQPQPQKRVASQPPPPKVVKASSPAAKKQLIPPISEITLQREPGYTRKPQPFYTLVLRNDGTAIYIGIAFSKLEGAYKATLPASKFARLAQLIEESHFFNYDPFYGPAGVDDVSTATVSVVRKGKRKTVLDAGKPMQPRFEKEAPKSFRLIQGQIDAAVAHVKWVKASGKIEIPRYIPDITEWREKLERQMSESA